VHAGFSGLRAFVARKKGLCKLIANRFVIPHDTIPSNVVWHLKTATATIATILNKDFFMLINKLVHKPLVEWRVNGGCKSVEKLSKKNITC
jgi:hypothetical protein